MTHPFVTFELRGGILPTRGSDQAAGLDLYAAEGVVIPPQDFVKIDLGIRSSFSKGWVALIWPRSGLAAKKGIDTMAGVIDSDYRGTWGVILANHGRFAYHVEPRERVAQVLFQPVWTGLPIEGKVQVDTERGDGGFGSTG
jgi:dUTP pyrophosphatase